ncbi:MAG: hypothetical protein LBB58_00330, partial [Cellulomonadaceae bacterium]|nr:hypothetical protein [Cellulomonadaceae bacterium]
GFLGIGEPLIYGVTLPLGRPFITACIGGAFGGATIGLLGQLAHQPIGATVVGPSGIALLPLITGGVWKYILGLLVAYLVGFLATYFFGVPRDAMDGDDAVDEAVSRNYGDPAFSGAYPTASYVAEPAGAAFVDNRGTAFVDDGGAPFVDNR